MVNLFSTMNRRYPGAVTQLETPARSRTRQAILDAAIAKLANDGAASLAEIATAAAVGRTTLHRYFAERSDLFDALTVEVARRLAEAEERARLAEGTGREALLRLAREYFDLGDALSFMFAGQIDVESAYVATPGACSSTEAIERGRTDGSLDDEQPAAWIENLLWCALYAGWSFTQESGGSRHESLRLVVRSLEGAIGSRS